ncbi:MAG: hypothetical protein AB8G22_14690 [Saprospiraceae bacterium]
MSTNNFITSFTNLLDSSIEFTADQMVEQLSDFAAQHATTSTELEQVTAIQNIFRALTQAAIHENYKDGIEFLQAALAVLENYAYPTFQQMAMGYLLYFETLELFNQQRIVAAAEKSAQLTAWIEQHEAENERIQLLKIAAGSDQYFMQAVQAINQGDWLRAEKLVNAAAECTLQLAELFPAEDPNQRAFLGLGHYYYTFFEVNYLAANFFLLNIEKSYVEETYLRNAKLAIEYLSQVDFEFSIYKKNLLMTKALMTVAKIIIEQNNLLFELKNASEEQLATPQIHSVHLDRYTELAIALAQEGGTPQDAHFYQRVRIFSINIDRLLKGILQNAQIQIKNKYQKQLHDQFADIRHLVAQGEIKKALNQAYQNVNHKAALDKILLLRSRLSKAEIDQMTGIIGTEKATIETANVVQGLLFILNELEENIADT